TITSHSLETSKPRLLSSIHFPYTTLFRSRVACTAPARSTCDMIQPPKTSPCTFASEGIGITRSSGMRSVGIDSGASPMAISFGRSEEHTSELQSRENLVCRLLLEKKNNKL